MLSETGTARVGTCPITNLNEIENTVYPACSDSCCVYISGPTVNTESSGEFGLDLDPKDVFDPKYQARASGAIPGSSQSQDTCTRYARRLRRRAAR